MSQGREKGGHENNEGRGSVSFRNAHGNSLHHWMPTTRACQAEECLWGRLSHKPLTPQVRRASCKDKDGHSYNYWESVGINSRQSPQLFEVSNKKSVITLKDKDHKNG